MWSTNNLVHLVRTHLPLLSSAASVSTTYQHLARQYPRTPKKVRKIISNHHLFYWYFIIIYYYLIFFIIFCQIFSQDGSEVPLVDDRLGDLDQARKVAREAHHQYRGRHPEKKRPLPDLHPAEDVYGESPMEDPDDALPPGITWKDIPRFKKVFGWDKDNVNLRWGTGKKYFVFEILGQSLEPVRAEWNWHPVCPHHFCLSFISFFPENYLMWCLGRGRMRTRLSWRASDWSWMPWGPGSNLIPLCSLDWICYKDFPLIWSPPCPCTKSLIATLWDGQNWRRVQDLWVRQGHVRLEEVKECYHLIDSSLCEAVWVH